MESRSTETRPVAVISVAAFSLPNDWPAHTPGAAAASSATAASHPFHRSIHDPVRGNRDRDNSNRPENPVYIGIAGKMLAVSEKILTGSDRRFFRVRCNERKRAYSDRMDAFDVS